MATSRAFSLPKPLRILCNGSGGLVNSSSDVVPSCESATCSFESRWPKMESDERLQTKETTRSGQRNQNKCKEAEGFSKLTRDHRGGCIFWPSYWREPRDSQQSSPLPSSPWKELSLSSRQNPQAGSISFSSQRLQRHHRPQSQPHSQRIRKARQHLR